MFLQPKGWAPMLLRTSAQPADKADGRSPERAGRATKERL
jgi:hypothetical protein